MSTYYVPDTTLHPLNTYHLSFILTQSCCVFLCVCLGCSVGWTVELGWGREVNLMVISDEQHLKKYLENLKTVKKKKKKKKNLGGKERKSEVSRSLGWVSDSAFYSFFRTDDLSDHPANFCPPPRPEVCSLYSQSFYILKHTPLIHTRQQLYTTPGSDQSELTFWFSFLTVF